MVEEEKSEQKVSERLVKKDNINDKTKEVDHLCFTLSCFQDGQHTESRGVAKRTENEQEVSKKSNNEIQSTAPVSQPLNKKC